jgi:hypothetical protein
MQPQLLQSLFDLCDVPMSIIGSDLSRHKTISGFYKIPLSSGMVSEFCARYPHVSQDYVRRDSEVIRCVVQLKYSRA